MRARVQFTSQSAIFCPVVQHNPFSELYEKELQVLVAGNLYWTFSTTHTYIQKILFICMGSNSSSLQQVIAPQNGSVLNKSVSATIRVQKIIYYI